MYIGYSSTSFSSDETKYRVKGNGHMKGNSLICCMAAPGMRNGNEFEKKSSPRKVPSIGKYAMHQLVKFNSGKLATVMSFTGSLSNCLCSL